MQRFNGRNLAIVGGLLAVTDLLIGGMWIQARQHDSATITAYRVTHPVVPGTRLTAADVAEVHVPDPANGLSYRSTSPVGETVKVGLAPSDILRADDLVGRDEGMSRVALTLAMAPAMTPGDRIDIYAGSGACSVQVGWNVPVLVQGTNGEPTTVVVDKKVEAQLVGISARKIPLIAAVSAVPAPHDATHAGLSELGCPGSTQAVAAGSQP
jgi:hypothetical protein